MSQPQLRAAGILGATILLVVIVYESVQARGGPGMIDMTTNQAYVGHFAVYATLAFAAMATIGRRTIPAIALVILISVCLGAGLELVQAHLPTRTSSFADALSDIAGAVTGVLLYLAITAILPQPSPVRVRKR